MKTRIFLPTNFEVTDWETLKPWYDKLVVQDMNSPEALLHWLRCRSELESVVSENLGWRYIRMTCDTANNALQEAYNYFITEIEPNIQPYSNTLNQRFISNPLSSQLQSEADQIMRRSIASQLRIFRDENIPLLTEMQQLQVTYGAIVGGLSVQLEGQDITLQKASTYLFKTDRTIRELAWRTIQEKRETVASELQTLYSKLITLRHRIAQQAGFSNYRDYMFTELSRFDYTPQDCFTFHDSVQQAVVPLVQKQAAKRKSQLKVDALRPWDLSVDPHNEAPLKPFTDGNDLTAKTKQCFQRIAPQIAAVIETMEGMQHLDLESRKGKAPGGYNYPLYETGIPFIFMNAAGTVRDLVTMVHEGGHALHSVLTKDLDLMAYKNVPSEIAELASMSMELISMEHWDVFFDNPQDLKRAKRDHLEQIIETLPWVALIDKFQHWVYEHPEHSPEQRIQKWLELHRMFSAEAIDWNGLEAYRHIIWQKQLHLYEVPFYYIEYGMAQLGAIAVWRNYKQQPDKGLQAYLEALKLGYTQSIGNVYQKANIAFDFSAQTIAELMAFVSAELALLED